MIILIVVGVMITAYVTYSSTRVGVLEKSIASKEPVINITPTPAVSISEREEVRSPDGSMKIIMQKTKAGNGITSYSFFVTGPETSMFEIYSKTLTTGEMSVPLNSWSPDHKYLFITENDGNVDNYLVFKSTGKVFVDGKAYIDFRSHYTLKMTEFSLKDVTGWDAPDLLHVRTSGPPYWFELGSNAFYRLVQR